ncbi:MAG TPA: anthranilate synthase component I family protein [Polyangiales bacterium]|nr:anthranilate synthase component I family protein [Polyangiales bacterium]
MWAERIASTDELTLARSLSAAPGFAWLDSNRSEARDGRYSFLSAWPAEEIRVPFGAAAPFAALREARGTAATTNPEGPSPSETPSWIGYIAYDAFWSNPPRGTPRFARAGAPIILFRRYPALIAIDHEANETWLLGDDQGSCRAFFARLRQTTGTEKQAPRIGPIEVDDAQLHKRAIEKALRYIEMGQVYEVNVARRWSASFDGDALRLWQAMRAASRVPLGMFLDAGDHAVLACTMERFLRWNAQSRLLVTRPIKGTIRRVPTDDGASERLRADPKEQAEHSMIVDLMRNDFGRVAKTGSVEVDAPLIVEPFTGLYHLVSTVHCTTRADVRLEDVLDATFPPGSVTGAPKIRAVEIIEELERHPRGIYCGALGFVDHCGGLSLAVAIRTAVVREREVCYWAGGGIVEASDPEREVAETELKARVFLDAVESLGADLPADWR